MWTRWRVARRVSTASSTALRPLVAPYIQTVHAPGCVLDGRLLSTENGPLQSEPSRAEDDAHAKARRCLADLSRTLRRARTAEQLTTLWSILSRNEPVVVVDGDFLRPVGSHANQRDEATDVVAIPARSLAVRMVRVAEMVALVQQGKRHTVVENAPSFAASPSFLNATNHKDENDSTVTTTRIPAELAMGVPHDHVLLVSELFIARKIIWALYRLGSHLELTHFFEAFEAERRDVRSQTKASDSAASDSEALVVELTTLGNHINALYVASLGRVHAHAKLLTHFEQSGDGDLSRFLASRDAFRSLLHACMMERNGRLARSILDQALDSSTHTTFNTKPFTLALHACLRKQTKSLEGLQHAMHIYRRMFHEVGYILAPHEWSLLFNACVYLSQHDLAMEIFRDYRAHGIAPFQRRFQYALRTACRNAQYDTSVAMMRAWIEIEQQQPQQQQLTDDAASAAEDRWRRDAEDECLIRILWEMLKGAPSRDHIEQVLVRMQSRGCIAGALSIRRLVGHFFTTATDDDQLAPAAVLYRFFDLWERVPETIQRTSFVLHLVLEECEARGWSEQCEHVIEYALEKHIELPITSTTKLMDRYAARGQFDDAIRLGELVLQPRLEKLTAAIARGTKKKTNHRGNARNQLPGGIPDPFFESLLRCYLFRERFDDVVRVDDAFQLTACRSSANAALATILRDARAMTS